MSSVCGEDTACLLRNLNSDFELFFSLADDVMSTFLITYTFRVRYLSSYLYPGILSMGTPDTWVSIDGRT